MNHDLLPPQRRSRIAAAAIQLVRTRHMHLAAHPAPAPAPTALASIWRGLGAAEEESRPAQPDDGDGAVAAKPGTDWREHLTPEIAGLLTGNIDAAEALVGEHEAQLARRRVAALAKQQALVEREHRKDEVKTRALRAAHLIAARKLNGWDQEEAARRLGYSNSTQLSLLESGSREVKLDHVVRASEVYKVSADFLLGRTPSEVELDARTLAADRVLDGIRHVTDLLMRHVDASDRLSGGPTAEHYRRLLGSARAVVSAARRVDGDALEAIKGGSTMAYAVEQLAEEVVEAARRMAGFQGEIERLRELLRAAPANDPDEKNGSAHSA